VGDTSAFARVVHPVAVPPFPTERIRPPYPRAPKLAIPPSRLAQVLMPHQRLLARVPSTRTGRISVASPPRRIPPRRDRFRNNPHGRIPKRAILADAHLPACADAAPLGRLAAVSERRTREAQPTSSCPTVSRDLPVHIIATRSGCRAARLRGTVLEGASCSAEQRAGELELVFAEPAPGRPASDTRS
jgi:hypothetical protein